MLRGLYSAPAPAEGEEETRWASCDWVLSCFQEFCSCRRKPVVAHAHGGSQPSKGHHPKRRENRRAGEVKGRLQRTEKVKD